jgi:hypothetical protein
MFIKETTFTRKSGRKVTYLQLVTSVWDKEKKTPRHKVLCSLGRVDLIDPNQLKGLIDKLKTYVDQPDLDEAGKIQVGQTDEFGILTLKNGTVKLNATKVCPLEAPQTQQSSGFAPDLCH